MVFLVPSHNIPIRYRLDLSHFTFYRIISDNYLNLFNSLYNNLDLFGDFYYFYTYLLLSFFVLLFFDYFRFLLSFPCSLSLCLSCLNFIYRSTMYIWFSIVINIVYNHRIREVKFPSLTVRPTFSFWFDVRRIFSVWVLNFCTYLTFVFLQPVNIIIVCLICSSGFQNFYYFPVNYYILF